MNQTYSLKIDVYSHIIPPKFKEILRKVAPWFKMASSGPTLWDLDSRFRLLDSYQPLVQVLTLAYPPIETFANSKKAVELAKLANDEMAELVHQYPHRFASAIACLPLNNVDAALRETDRAINDLRFRGVLVYTPVNDKPLDSPEFTPLYEKMCQYNLPIYIHPMRMSDYPDYRTEKESKYLIHSIFGWPYDTTVAMTRLVFSGIMQKFPSLKIITHHCGAMVPYFEQRIIQFYDTWEMLVGAKYNLGLTKAPIEYFKMFYNDTALYGNPSALMCAYNFCGADHMLFGTDVPLGDSQIGYRHYRQTINAVEQMNITDAEKKMIFEDNARKLLRLPV